MPALLDPREEHFRIPSSHAGLSLFLRHLPPPDGDVAAAASCCMCMARRSRPRCRSRTASMAARGVTNYAPRASMSGVSIFMATAIRIRIPPCRRRRMDASRSAPRRMPANNSNRLCGSSVSITRSSGFRIIAHSWGTIVAGRFAARCPSLVDRLVLFGAIARRNGELRRRTARRGVWFRCRINGSASPRKCRPANCPCCRADISPNGANASWTATRPAGRERRPACRRRVGRGSTSAAPGRAISRTSPRVCARRWRSSAASGTACAPMPTPPGCSARSQSSPIRRDVKISRGTHLMHLEASRYALYRETQNFLAGGDEPARVA